VYNDYQVSGGFDPGRFDPGRFDPVDSTQQRLDPGRFDPGQFDPYVWPIA
jgi:hypothetical protein